MEDIGLSANALAALKEFAQDNKIQVSEDKDIVTNIQKALNISKENPYTTFEFNFNNEKQNITLKLKGIEQECGQTLQSTGLTLWRASEDLAEFLFQNQQQFKGKKVLELGAGLGLVGILLGHINQEGIVTVTDGDEENGNTLDLLKLNIKENSSLLKVENLKVQRLWWGDEKEIEQCLKISDSFQQENEQGYDYIVGADVVYSEQSVSPLIYTVNQLLKKNKDSRFYLAFARRNIPIDSVFQQADKYNLVYEEVKGFNCKLNEEHIYVFKRKL